MAGSQSDSFFWNDWQGDPLLRACSHSAQGVWMRLLCIAAESKKKGYVLLNGKAPDVLELVPVIGGTLESVTGDIAELEKWGVFSRDRNGIIYCRKMVRDAKKRSASAKGGKIGGRVTADEHKGIHATRGGTRTPTRNVTRHPKARSSSFSSSSSFSKSSSVPNGTGAQSAPEIFQDAKQGNGKTHPPPAKLDLKKQVYDRGKEIFGSSAGGIITNILKAKENKYAKALALIEDAGEKRDPVSWINAWLWEHGPPGLQVGPMSPAL